MTWQDYALARQQQVQEHIGVRVRRAKRREDAIAQRNKELLEQQERHAGSG